MKAGGIVINMTEDTAVVLDDTVNLRTISTGHYTLSLLSDDPHYGSYPLSGVNEYSCVANKSYTKKKKRREKTLGVAAQTSGASFVNRVVARSPHDFDGVPSPHGSTSTVAPWPLQAHGERLALYEMTPWNHYTV